MSHHNIKKFVFIIVCCMSGILLPYSLFSQSGSEEMLVEEAPIENTTPVEEQQTEKEAIVKKDTVLQVEKETMPTGDLTDIATESIIEDLPENTYVVEDTLYEQETVSLDNATYEIDGTLYE